jgi:transposase
MIKRWEMYSRIQTMKGQGFSLRKTAKILGFHRNTIKRYWNMTVEEFSEEILEPAKKSSLEHHKELILSWLREYPEISAAQVYDWLKEKFNIHMSEGSIRRYVRGLRVEYDIKGKGNKRDYESRQDPPMGLQMQIDIGSISVENIRTRRYQKLYCIGFVLSHSRYKYGVWFSKAPTAIDMVNAIRSCFEWMGGKPKELVFDQDRLIAVDENYGDIIYTKEFEAFRQSEKLDVYLCRKGDPETKGRIEAVVKYFKYNFARYRQYSEDWHWEEDFEKWLHRTGNGKIHSVTKKIPAEVFEIEQKYLTPVVYEKNKSINNTLLRNIRKDNTVLYEGNRYTVPTGTFGSFNQAQLEIQNDELLIYGGFCDVLLAKHKICFEKGKLIQNNNHLRNKEHKIAELKKELLAKFTNPDEAMKLLDLIHLKKPRHARDQFKLIEKTILGISQEVVSEAISYCLQHELYSAVDFRDATIYFKNVLKNKEPADFDIKYKKHISHSIPETIVAKRDLQEMINSLKGGDDTWLN